MNTSTLTYPPLIGTASMGVFLFINSLIALLGICGNTLVITAFFVSTKVRSTKYNFFLFSLAVADLMACLVCLPIWNFVLYCESLPQPPVSLESIEHLQTNNTASAGGKQQSGVDHTKNVYDAYHSYLDPLFGVASIINLLAVSIVRCLAVHFPVLYSRLSNMCFVLAAFLFPWGIGLLSLVYLRFVDNMWLEKMLVFIVLVYFIPLLFIICSCCLIILGVGITRINNNAEEASKHVVMIGLVVFCFIVTWAPFFAVTLVFIHCTACPYISLAGMAAIKTLQYSNSVMNVFIYAWQCKDFREAFRKILRAILSLCDKRYGRAEMEPAWKDVGLSTVSIAPVLSVEF